MQERGKARQTESGRETEREKEREIELAAAPAFVDTDLQ